MISSTEMQDIANAHAAHRYGAAWDAEPSLTFSDPAGTHYLPHKIGTPPTSSWMIDTYLREKGSYQGMVDSLFIQSMELCDTSITSRRPLLVR